MASDTLFAKAGTSILSGRQGLPAEVNCETPEPEAIG
jgi:hypothetical protein